MEELLKLLEQTNNESELFEELLISTLHTETTGYEKALNIAARIQAGRDIRFDLKKVIKENEKRD